MQTLKNLDIDAVKSLAVAIASKVRSTGGTIGLIGPLGAGKTLLAKTLLRELGIKQASSPTFVIAHQYRQKNRLVNHLDLYRLSRPEQLIDLGLKELLIPPHINIIEWADKFPQIKKQCDVVLTLRIKPDNLRDAKIQFN